MTQKDDRNIDDWITSATELTMHSECEQCGNEIFVGEDYYEVDYHNNVHEECLDEFLRESADVVQRTAKREGF